VQVQARTLLPRFEMPVMVNVPDGTLHPSGNMSLPCKLAINPATGFLAISESEKPTGNGRQETARFPCTPQHQQAVTPASSVSPTVHRPA